jgi:hypothetical protein
MAIPVCITDTYEIISGLDDAIDLDLSDPEVPEKDKDGNALPTEHQKIMSKYTDTGDLDLLPIKPGMTPVKFVCRPLTKRERRHYSRKLDGAEPGDLGDLAIEMAETVFTDIKDYYTPDGEPVEILKAKYTDDLGREWMCINKMTIEKIPFSVLIDLFMHVLRENKMKADDKKK